MNRYEYARSVIIQRAQYLEEISRSEEALRADWLQCKESFVTYCDRWAWMNDLQAVREGFGETGVPFVLWDSQIEIAEWVLSYVDLPSIANNNRYELRAERKRETTILVIPKGRKIGVTELLLQIEEWLMIYWKMTCIVGSTTAEDVDKAGDPRSLFERIYFSLSRLPEHVRPRRLWRKERTISDLNSSASILGESATGDFMRAGRSVLALLDEWATLEPNTANKQLSSIHSACDVAVIVSNPPRRRHPIHKLCETLPPEQIMQRSWRDDPWRDEGYFEAQLVENGGTLTREDAERELNGSLEIVHSSTVFTFNKQGIMIPQKAPDLGAPISLISFDFGTGQALTVSLHANLWLGDEDELNALGQLLFRLEIYEEHYWQGAHVKTIAADTEPSRRAAAEKSTYQFIIGDPTGINQISPTQGSWQSELWNQGIKVQCLDNPFNTTEAKEDATAKFSELHALGRISITAQRDRAIDGGKILEAQSKDSFLIESMTNWIWPFREGETRIDYVKISPEKSVYSHACEAFLYLIHKSVMLAEELRRERENRKRKVRTREPLITSGKGSRRAVRDLYRGLRGG